MHVLVHEIQNGEPEGSKGGQRQERREVLEEDLEKQERCQRRSSGGKSRDEEEKDAK